MRVSINAADLLASHADTLVAGFEGLVLSAYKDQGGVWTIGYGHTGPEVVPGLVWIREQCIEALRHDLLTADNAIENDVNVTLNQNQFDALVSFDYNIGEGHLKSSTTLRKLNAGDYQGAADAMLMWEKVAGKDNPGLMHRRIAERKLFLQAM
jgi:lysozyme